MRFNLLLVTFVVGGLVAFCIPIPVLSQQLLSIKGIVPKNFGDQELLLYKYRSAFDQELISRINVTNYTFSFKRELTEPDAYLLKNTVDNTFFLFIWDGHLTIDWTGPRFYEPLIRGSPLTTELERFNKLNQDRHFQPIRKLDTLITNVNDKVMLDSLQQVRRDLIDWSKVASKAYRLQYYRDQADSFVSLFLLTVSGDEFPIEPEYRAAFEGLSDRLKKHSRARYYLER